jgi:hypothetical protein
MYHVKRYHLPIDVTPDHRSVAGVLQGIPPDQGVELGDAHPDQAVSAVTVGEGVGEDSI